MWEGIYCHYRDSNGKNIGIYVAIVQQNTKIWEFLDQWRQKGGSSKIQLRGES